MRPVDEKSQKAQSNMEIFFLIAFVAVVTAVVLECVRTLPGAVELGLQRARREAEDRKPILP